MSDSGDDFVIFWKLRKKALQHGNKWYNILSDIVYIIFAIYANNRDDKRRSTVRTRDQEEFQRKKIMLMEKCYDCYAENGLASQGGDELISQYLAWKMDQFIFKYWKSDILLISR